MYSLPSVERERPPDTPEGDAVLPAQPKRGRKGATALEYLVMLSFILVALVWAVQHVGSVTKGMFSNAAAQAPTGEMQQQQQDTSNSNGP